MNKVNKVLIVEDNELNLKLFRDLLSIRKHKIIMSRDGIGLKTLVLKEKPDLILMDIYLGNRLGTDLIRELKENPITSHIPIIAITALALSGEKAQILESGCDMYLSKPVSIEIFFKAIDNFVNPE